MAHHDAVPQVVCFVSHDEKQDTESVFADTSTIVVKERLSLADFRSQIIGCSTTGRKQQTDRRGIFGKASTRSSQKPIFRRGLHRYSRCCGETKRSQKYARGAGAFATILQRIILAVPHFFILAYALEWRYRIQRDSAPTSIVCACVRGHPRLYGPNTSGT